MLAKNQIKEIKDNLDSCKNPLFMFDDDQDGLCSFLLFYRYKKEGHSFIVKTTPKIDRQFLGYVGRYAADKLFILDIAVVEQEFIDNVNVPIVWIDHHNPLQRDNVKYFNPRINGESVPTTYMAYKVIQKDMWVAAVGCIADWFIPDFMEEFEGEYPDLINKKYKNAGDILYGGTLLGKLIRIFSFILKGKSEYVNKSIRVMTRIQNPYEILRQETAQGRFLYKRYDAMNKRFENLYDDISLTAKKTKDRIILYRYKDDQTSFTSDLSNEISYNYPEKVVLVAREKNNEMKCSIRSTKNVLPPLIDKAILGLRGYGGGHEYACGLNIDADDFGEFLKRFKELIYSGGQ